MVGDVKMLHEAFGAIESRLASLFRNPPTADDLAALSRIAAPAPDILGERAAAALRDLSAGETDVQGARDDFHYLFVGPGKLGAAPWSSVYLDRGLLFGPAEQKTERAMLAQGLRIPEGHREPCDHFAYELSFVSEMHLRAARALDAGDGDRAAEAAEAGRAFMQSQLLPWAGPFAERVRASARTALYPDLADVAVAALRADAEFLESLGRPA